MTAFFARWPALLAALLALSVAAFETRGAECGMATVDRTNTARPLLAADPLSSLLDHPAFANVAERLLPWDDRVPDRHMPLREIGALLPYHSRVDVEDVVGALNRLVADASAGEQVCFDFYTESEKRADPSKRHTALFFFRGKPDAPFAVIAPGGGFEYVGSVHEGFPYADRISKAGYNAFVLKYRAGLGADAATADLAAALSYVMRESKKLRVRRGDYSLWGSSAGARMAAAVGSHGASRFGGADLPQPATVVMAYTGHSDVTAHEPPTFVVVGSWDRIAPPATMQRRVEALRRSGADVEFHVFQNLGHGFGPGVGTSAEGWIADATRFWELHMTKGERQ
jgi:acetyl esterase/lipase